MKLVLKYLLLVPCIAGYIYGYPQTIEVQKTVDNINRSIDEAVVKKDVNKLKQVYADDFVFTHGTGYVEGKTSWIKDVENPTKKFTSRVHDSTLVELHDNVAIVTGSLAITRSDADKLVRYGIRYVRVFALRNNSWQLISHRTVKEWHFK
jgi:ketosteroid isomerase-like protein